MSLCDLYILDGVYYACYFLLVEYNNVEKFVWNDSSSVCIYVYPTIGAVVHSFFRMTRSSQNTKRLASGPHPYRFGWFPTHRGISNRYRRRAQPIQTNPNDLAIRWDVDNSSAARLRELRTVSKWVTIQATWEHSEYS